MLNNVFRGVLPNLGYLIILLILTLPIIAPFFHSGFFPSHDGEWAVVRLGDMFREVRDLQIPARYSGVLNLEYGYPLFNFAYPGPYYMGLIFYILGFGLVGSIKLLFALSVLISGVFMYVLSREIWQDKLASLLAAVSYIYFPYRFVDLFVRGSIGESISFAIFPLVVLSVIKIYRNPISSSFMLLGGLTFGLLIVTHNIMAVLFSLFLLFLSGFLVWQKKEILKPLALLFSLGFLLSAFFWIPALLEKKYILLSIVPIADRNQFFVSLKQFIFPSWGYGVPTDTVHGFTYQLGFPFLIILASGAFYVLKEFFDKKNMGNFNFKLVFMFFILDLFFIFFLFKSSAIFWKLPLLSEINFPWTMLPIIVFISSLIIGFLSTIRFFKFLTLTLITLAVIYFLPYAKPQYYVDRGDNFYLTNQATTTSSLELMPIWVKTFPAQAPKEKIEALKGKGKLSDLRLTSKNINFNFVAEDQSTIRINRIYYPGCKIIDNGEEKEINYDNKFGVMDIILTQGTHKITAKFSETPIRLVSNLISVFTLIIFLSYSLKLFRLRVSR